MTIAPKRVRISLGFSLLEMVISIAILAMVSIVFSQVFISTLRSNTKTELLKEVKQNGDLSMATMVRMVQNAESATCPDTQTLTLVNPDGGTTTFACGMDGATTRLASESGITTEFVSSGEVTLGGSSCPTSSLAFACTEAPGAPTIVRITFSLAQKGTGVSEFEKASESFTDTVSMRSTPQ